VCFLPIHELIRALREADAVRCFRAECGKDREAPFPPAGPSESVLAWFHSVGCGISRRMLVFLIQHIEKNWCTWQTLGGIVRSRSAPVNVSLARFPEA
jgi:hypothetical protein